MFPKEKENIFFQSPMDESNPLEEIRTWEHPPWYGIDQENQNGLFHHFTTHFWMPVKRLMIFAQCQETSYNAVTLDQESNFTRRERKHSLFHWSTLTYPELFVQIWMSNKRNASMITAILMGQETCRIHGQVLPNLLYWEKNLPTDICGPRRETNEKTADIQARSSMARTLGENGKETPRWRRSRSGHMKSSILITRENCEGSISLTRRIRNPKKTSRILVRNWKHLCLLPCKIMKKNCGSGASNKVKTRLACILEAGESTKLRMGNSIPHHHQDHIAGKGENSLQHYNLVHKFILMPQAMKILQRKHRWTRNVKNWRKFRRGTWQKSEAKKRWSMKQGRPALQFILHHWRTYVIWKMLNWRQSTKNNKGRVVLRGDIVKKTIQDLMQYFSNKDYQLLKWQQQKSWISSPDCQVAMDKQRTQYLFKPKWKWKMFTKNWKFQNRNVQTWGFVFSDTNGQNHGPVWKFQSFLLSGICIIIFWQDHCRKDNLRKSSWNMAGRKFPIGNVSSYTVKKIIFICVCGWHQIDWKETKRWSDVESTQQRSRLGRTNIFPGSWKLGLHPKTIPNKQRYCGQLQSHVRIENFRGESREITIPSKSSFFFMVFWHGWSCKEVCGTILWWPQFKEEEMKSVGELSHVCCQIVLRCLNLARIGRPDIPWSVNKLARSITKWTKNLWQTPESIDFIHS